VCVLAFYALFEATLFAYQDHILIYQGSREDSRRVIEELLKTCNIYIIVNCVFFHVLVVAVKALNTYTHTSLVDIHIKINPFLAHVYFILHVLVDL